MPTQSGIWNLKQVRDGVADANYALALVISTISGTIYNTVATNLTITGSGFGLSATVRFSYGGSQSDVVVAPDSDNQITVAVPSAVYNQAGGTSVIISVIAGGQASNGSSNTVVGFPTGGTVTTSGSYRIHTFLSSSSFVVPAGFTASAQYLVVAGGGGGGGGLYHGGGGGAGGYRTNVFGETSGGGSSAESVMTLTAQTYTVTVGLGGAGAISGPSQGSSGGQSVFGNITSVGGGKGGMYNGDAPFSGGSGGGADYTHNPGAVGTTGQGFAGGTGNGASPGYGSGGGGGAGGLGGNGTSSTGGNGGVGVQSNINGTPTYRGGGGGGSIYTSGTPGAGGNGGGGAGSFTGNDQAGSGIENTGGGGGGAERNAYNVGGAGGSGIVIVRYPIPT